MSIHGVLAARVRCQPIFTSLLLAQLSIEYMPSRSLVSNGARTACVMEVGVHSFIHPLIHLFTVKHRVSDRQLPQICRTDTDKF